MTDQNELSGPVEDYLKAIYDVERTEEVATTNEIAQRLSIAPASVSGMSRRLAEQGLVTHERYHGVRLTDAGRRAALRTLRRHRVLETYLVQVLGFTWDEVHAEAERLEHAASDSLIDRMAHALGDPSVDPHGAPIPTRDGTVEERRLPSLAEVETGGRVRVVRVDDDDAERLRYLEQLGIRPGAEVEVLERAPYGGPISVFVEEARRELGPGLAGGIQVEPTE